MTKIVEFRGRKLTVDRSVEMLAFVPTGEAEMHVFANNVFIGTAPELEEYLQRIKGEVNKNCLTKV